MRRIVALVCLVLAALAAPAHAGWTKVSETTVVEEWIDGQWVEIAREEGIGSGRFLSGANEEAVRGIAEYGPFRVLDARRAALVGITDENSPADFAALLRDHPAIETLELIDCPGTYDDKANLRLGRMIRAAGLATHVPRGGSVRSGAVELFIAGARRTIEDGARFAVHAWMDEDGREATQYAASDPENRKYLAFYREMGMDAEEARSFYALTNSAPHEEALWLSAEEMRGWIATADGAPAAPRLAYLGVVDLDLGAALN